MDNFAENGFEVVANILKEIEIAHLKSQIQQHIYSDSIHGIRQIERKVPAIALLANSAKITNLLAIYTKKRPKLVRGIYFNKNKKHNWLVSWHQDKTIAVKDKIVTPGFTNWTVKQGVVHVQPPLTIMENIITLRIHLDAAGVDNGALRVIPKSHQLGILNSAAIKNIVAHQKPKICAVNAGDILVMNPLILHSSFKSKKNCHRAIIHLEYALTELPNNLSWAET